MKNTLPKSALAALALLALAGSLPLLQAAPAATASAAPAMAHSKYTTYSGTITALSPTSISISGTVPLTLAIDATTKFKKSKKVATEADFAVGDVVTGSYAKSATGDLIAHSVHKKGILTAKK